MMVIDGVEMVDVREAARLAGRSPETIRRWVWSGRVRATKAGNKLFVPRADVPEERQEDRESTAIPGWHEWYERVVSLKAAQGEGATPGRTASDLVLDDRAERASR